MLDRSLGEAEFEDLEEEEEPASPEELENQAEAGE